MIAVCSNKVRPSVHTGRKNSAWGWQRDVYRLEGVANRTLCGINSAGWLVMGPMEELTPHCCERCRVKFKPTPVRTDDGIP